jgi:hypothetical protein
MTPAQHAQRVMQAWSPTPWPLVHAYLTGILSAAFKAAMSDLKDHHLTELEKWARDEVERYDSL